MILFLDAVGGSWDGNTPKTKPIGGSELAQIQLAEALADRGHTVRVLNQAHFTGTAPYQINGVTYGGAIDANEVKTCILARMTSLPRQISMAKTKVIVSLTDQGPHDIAPCHLVVGVSQWQVNRFSSVAPSVPCKVIPPIVEAAPQVTKTPLRYIYAGAAMKGLDASLDGWVEAGKPGLLEVCHGGWGHASVEQQDRMSELRVLYHGDMTPAGLRERISRASYLLGAKTYPETFCAVAAIAETCGTVPILYSPHGRTGLDEAINAQVYYDRANWVQAIKDGKNTDERARKACVFVKDYSADRIARLWEKVLNT